MKAMVLIMKAMLLLLALTMMPWFSFAGEVDNVRQLAAKYNVTCILVFGDSSVDPGNNNGLQTTMKSNFPPYGKDFFDGRPTGRFSNGRLTPDFIADIMGLTKAVPAFLDPNLKMEDLPHGVSFASAATGYDDFTANISSVLPMSKQLEYFEHYRIHLGKFLGKEKAEFIVRHAAYVLSMGSNDFLQNYFLDPTRPQQFTVQQYQNFLVSRMSQDIKVMHRLGANILIVVGVPPLGCMPLMKSLKNQKSCVVSLNRVAYSFNAKLKQQLQKAKAKLGIKTAFVDAYGIIQRAVTKPEVHGFSEGSKGCCGTGTVEYGETCKGMSTCLDPTKYVFWDAVHPTEAMYKQIADEAIASVSRELTA